MENTVVVAVSAISAPAVDMIGGQPVEAVEGTLFDIGFQSRKAEKLMADGKAALDTLDANLNDFVVGLPYMEFMRVRDIVITGAVDAGATADGAQKQWERQINRIVSGFSFVKPKSESPDAVRKQEQKAVEIAKLATFSEEDLVAQRTALLGKGDNKSVREALKLGKEVERRNSSLHDAEKSMRKALADSLIARVKELQKAGTADADALLAAAVAALEIEDPVLFAVN